MIPSAATEALQRPIGTKNSESIYPHNTRGNRASTTLRQLRTIERTRNVTNPALVLAQHRRAGEVAGA